MLTCGRILVPFMAHWSSCSVALEHLLEGKPPPPPPHPSHDIRPGLWQHHSDGIHLPVHALRYCKQFPLQPNLEIKLKLVCMKRYKAERVSAERGSQTFSAEPCLPIWQPWPQDNLCWYGLLREILGKLAINDHTSVIITACVSSSDCWSCRGTIRGTHLPSAGHNK